MFAKPVELVAFFECVDSTFTGSAPNGLHPA
jgi:hypothetical protein